jgi:hypothetical protein
MKPTSIGASPVAQPAVPGLVDLSGLALESAIAAG